MSPLKIYYPNGQTYHYNNDDSNQTQKEQTYNNSNKRMSLEKEINLTNKQYLTDNIAVNHKKPTQIQVVKVDYPKREAAKITEAYYRRSSTTDYNGVYKGYYLDFEAKETKNKTSFPLNNFHEHQIKHMKQSTEHGGICFTILRFATLVDIYLLHSYFLFKWWDQQFEEKGQKSIPLSAIKKENFLIEYRFNPRIPYLKIVDQLIENIK